MDHISKDDVLGVIFCGGRAVRLGGISKMDIELGGRNLLSHAAAHLHGYVKAIALSVKPDTPLPDAHGFEIIYDLRDESVAFALLSALKYAKDKGYSAILTLPVDTPFLPDDYAAAMIGASQDVDCLYAKYDGHIQGLHCLWKTCTYDGLEHQVLTDKLYRISALYDNPLSTSCLFTNVDKSHFLNINRPENVRLAQQIIVAG